MSVPSMSVKMGEFDTLERTSTPVFRSNVVSHIAIATTFMVDTN